MTPLDRRSFLAISLAVPAAAVLSACTPNPSPTATPVATGGAAQDLGKLPPGVFAGQASQTSDRPTLDASFGPNGTHFPDEIDWLGAASATELEVDCTWDAIIAAIAWLTPERVAAGATIRVRPGELVGAGSGSGDTPVLDGIGDPAWERNVVLVPKDGYGSVVIVDDGIRLNQVSRLSVFAFTGPGQGVVLTQCSGVQFGWGIWSTFAATQGGADLALYELVLGFKRSPHDTSAVRPTESFTMTNLERHGCVFGPSVKPDGDDAHCDTLQLERTGEGEFGPMLSVDCVDFGSSNAAIMIDGSISVVEFRHSLVLASTLPWEIYPLEPGDYVGDPNAFSGAGMDVRIFDSVVVGAVGRTGFTQVEDSILSYAPQPSQQPTQSGAWTVDESVASWSKADIEEAAGTDFSSDSLSASWSW